jgi:hypothetical protein
MPPRGSSAPKPTTRPARKPAARPLTPEYVEALKAYSRLLYDGGLAPKGVKRPETVAALIEVGRDVGLPATQAVAWIAIINGRPSIYGDAALGLIRSSGLLEEGYPKEWYEGDEGTEGYAAVFVVKRVGCPERTSRFSVADAIRADLWKKAGPWTQYPERQLMWRAKGFGCRDEFQDVLCGLVFVEEAEDMPPPPRVVVATDTPPNDRNEPPAGAAVAAAPRPQLPSQPAAVVVTEGGEPVTLHTGNGPVTAEQIDRLADLRDLLIAAKGCKTEADEDMAWLEVLADYGVESARELTTAQAAELIEDLAKAQDPFTHPPESWKTPAVELQTT